MSSLVALLDTKDIMRRFAHLHLGNIVRYTNEACGLPTGHSLTWLAISSNRVTTPRELTIFDTAGILKCLRSLAHPSLLGSVEDAYDVGTVLTHIERKQVTGLNGNQTWQTLYPVYKLRYELADSREILVRLNDFITEDDMSEDTEHTVISIQGDGIRGIIRAAESSADPLCERILAGR